MAQQLSPGNPAAVVTAPPPPPQAANAPAAAHTGVESHDENELPLQMAEYDADMQRGAEGEPVAKKQNTTAKGDTDTAGNAGFAAASTAASSSADITANAIALASSVSGKHLVEKPAAEGGSRR